VRSGSEEKFPSSRFGKEVKDDVIEDVGTPIEGVETE
jgi:hypothetical protein